MVIALGNVCGWGCMGNCVAICTRFDASARGAKCGELVFAGTFLDAIQYQQYCPGTWLGLELACHPMPDPPWLMVSVACFPV